MSQEIICSGALFYSLKTQRFLLLHRTQSKQKHVWGLVGGTNGKNEAPWPALQREIHEEVGELPDIIKTIPLETFISTDEKFSLDIGFLSETVKGVLSRQEKLPHIIQGLLDNIMAPSPTQAEDGTDVYYSKFDAPLLSELVDMAEDIKDDNQTEIAFESDLELETDPTEISEWKDKDDEDKDKD